MPCVVQTSLEDMDPLPNIEYVKVRHRVFSRKQDMVDSLVRSFARECPGAIVSVCLLTHVRPLTHFPSL